MHKMLNDMYENKKESIDYQNQFSKDHIQKIQSLKNIKHQKEKPPVSTKIVNVPNQKKPPQPQVPNNSGLQKKK